MRRLYAGLLILCYACQSADRSYDGWTKYKGSDECIQYSPLTQIDTANISRLKVIWEYHAGDVDTAHHSQMQCNPIMVDGLLYGTSPKMKLFAIDARTGQQTHRQAAMGICTTRARVCYSGHIRAGWPAIHRRRLWRR